jgi:hypothetical protein
LRVPQHQHIESMLHKHRWLCSCIRSMLGSYVSGLTNDQWYVWYKHTTETFLNWCP